MNLRLVELVLLRHWLNGLPVDALADYCGDKNPFAVVAGLRSRLLLKARRLDKGWGDAWLEKLRPINVETVADWLRHYQSCEEGRWWQSIPGLGDITASAIEERIGHHFPSELATNSPPAMP